MQGYILENKPNCSAVRHMFKTIEEAKTFAIENKYQWWRVMGHNEKTGVWEIVAHSDNKEPPRDIEFEVYQEMCAGCENEHYCHNACENCDEYVDEVERRYKEDK